MRTIADITAYLKNKAGAYINPASEDTVAQLVMAVNNALTLTAEDLNAGAYSGTTSISNDYFLDSLRLKFSTNEVRTITLTDGNGTKLYKDTNTLIDVYIPQSVIGGHFNGGENLTLTITQTAGACTVTGVLITTSGSNSLLGSPGVQWVAPDGTIRGWPATQGSVPRPRISSTDYLHEISAGNLAGHVTLGVFGERENIATVITGVDVWRGPTDQIPMPDQTNGEQMTFKFNDANDTAGGTGVRALRFDYIDSAGDAQTGSITANGGSVNTTATDITFINHVYSTSVGSNGVAVGNIDVHKLGDDTTVYNLIAAGGNKSLTCALKVPKGKTYFITEWHGGITGNKPSAIRLRSTDWNNILYAGVFIFKDVAFVGEDSFDRSLTPQTRIPGGTIAKISVWATQAGGNASGTINGFYE